MFKQNQKISYEAGSLPKQGSRDLAPIVQVPVTKEPFNLGYDKNKAPFKKKK